jgi:hypothetical protein
MTRDNYFDFNEASEPYRSLGNKLGAAVEDAAALTASTDDRFERVLAALRVARLAVARIIERDAASPEATAALIDITEGVAEAQKIVAENKPRLAGRPTDHERQAYAVVAFEWLQQLRKGKLDRDTALKAVAACIPSDMLQKRDLVQLAPVAQLEAWLDAFGRARNLDRKRAMANARGSLFDDFYREWREPLGRTSRGDLAYSYIIKRHDHLDASPTTVIEWLRNALSK